MTKIWIDLDNSPHVLLFSPVIRELQRRGINVVITTRDFAQVLELADMFGLKHKPIGHHYGKNKIIKMIGLIMRSLQMIPFYLKEKPDLVLSHGSRSMNIVATLFGIPIAEATDYEHAQHLPFVKPVAIMVPEVIPEHTVKNLAGRVIKYPGIKEDIYVPEFKPDANALMFLKLKDEDIVVSIRPPATAAHYHTQKSDELFEAVINFLVESPKAKIIITPRTKEQGEEIKLRWNEAILKSKMIIPDRVVHGLNLIWHSDIVISGGGTMIREAAALGVPAYSTFGGKMGSVDKYLEEQGRLVLISNADEVKSKIKIEKRIKTENKSIGPSKTLSKIVDEVEVILNERQK